MAQKLYEQLKAGGWSALDALVKANTEEGEQLDFKLCPPKQQEMEATVSKALSGFANTGGGLLVLGVKTSSEGKGKVDRASSIVPVPDVEATRGRVDQMAARLTDPPVPSLSLATLTPSPTAPEGVLLIHVPASDGGPHRATQGSHAGRYFIRTATTTDIMPHSMLAAMFGKTPPPKFSLLVAVDRSDFTVCVKNEGRGVASDVLVRISVLNGRTQLLTVNDADGGFAPHPNARLPLSGRPRYEQAYYLRNGRHIYPEETLPLARRQFPQPCSELRVRARIDAVGMAPTRFDGVVQTLRDGFEVVGLETR